MRATLVRWTFGSLVALTIPLVACELAVNPDLGLVVAPDASPCAVCLDDADTVVDVDGSAVIVPKAALDAGLDADAAADADASD